MNDKLKPAPPTMHDIAYAAGVSLATVDRALNERSGIAAKTALRVREAARELGWKPNFLAQSLSRRQALNAHVILPDTRNCFVRDLIHWVNTLRDDFALYRLVPEIVLVPELDPYALAERISELRRATDGLAILALDHPVVRAAIDEVVAAGKPVVTLVSDAPDSLRNVYVGIDNRSAGRTVGVIMGRYLPANPDPVAVFAGADLYCDLVEREQGFRELMSRRFPEVTVLPSTWDVEDDEHSYRAATRVLDDLPAISGLYVAGGGLFGAAQALEDLNRHLEIVLIGHDISGDMPRLLASGTVDVAISQDARTQVLRAFQVLSQVLTRSVPPGMVQLTDIGVYVAENLPRQHCADHLSSAES